MSELTRAAPLASNINQVRHHGVECGDSLCASAREHFLMVRSTFLAVALFEIITTALFKPN